MVIKFRFLFFSFIFFFSTLVLFAQNSSGAQEPQSTEQSQSLVSFSLEAYLTSLKADAPIETDPDKDEFLFSGVIDSILSLRTPPSLKAVRGEFALRFVADFDGKKETEDFNLSVYRAYLKAREGALQFTLGKAPVAWGEGYFFNSADLFFPSIASMSSFDDATVRDHALWLAEFRYFTGTYSFIDILGAIPLDSTIIPENSTKKFDIEDGAMGIRLGGVVWDTRLQLSSAYSGLANQTISLGASLHRGIFSDYLDFYLGTRLPLVSRGDFLLDNGGFGDLFELSGGLAHTQKRASDSITYRIEFLLSPEYGLSSQGNISDPNVDLGSLGNSGFNPTFSGRAAWLYADVSWLYTPNLNLAMRVATNLSDFSFYFLPGVNWSYNQYLAFFFNAGIGLGDKTDVFNFEKTGGFFASLGASLVL